jgi:hypothetical protein
LSGRQVRLDGALLSGVAVAAAGIAEAAGIAASGEDRWSDDLFHRLRPHREAFTVSLGRWHFWL